MRYKFLIIFKLMDEDKIKMEYSSDRAANKILIVDDEQPILETFIEMFKLKGFNCDGAENGLEALHLTERNNYDIIVSDINMPVMSGTAFFTKLQENNHQTPFIFITGYEVTSEINQVVKKATAIINKPVQFQELIDLIERIRISIN